MNDMNDNDQDRTILDCLRGDIDHEPPQWLDAQLRDMIGGQAQRTFFRPFVAFGLASAAFLAMLTGLAIALANTPMAESGLGIAVSIGFAYLAISAAAALPLLIEHRPRFVVGKVQA